MAAMKAHMIPLFASNVACHTVPSLLLKLTCYVTYVNRSFLISADMAHALHPNYSEKHEAGHRPLMHKGLVIKHNANQRYATNSITAFFLSEIARRYVSAVHYCSLYNAWFTLCLP
jgi:aspartyl aminopeptidase